LFWLSEVVAAVVVIVSVEVWAPLAIVTEPGDMLHVAGSLDAFVVNAQDNATVPVNPPEGVTVIVEVLPVVAPGATLMLPLELIANVPTAADTATFTVVVSVIEPEVPVTVTT
jgi:hypothetical protein